MSFPKRAIFLWLLLCTLPLFAVVCQPAPAAQGLFFVKCGHTHFASDDPIVYPGMPGAAHHHDFQGQASTNAFSTTASLFFAPSGENNCTLKADRSAIWVPTMMTPAGEPVPMANSNPVYYRTGYATQRLIPLPQGLRFIAGNQNATGYQSVAIIRWSCNDGSKLGDRPPTSCPGVQGPTMDVQFPTCWDGERLTSPNGKDHVRYGAGINLVGACPSTHPFRIPQIHAQFNWPSRALGGKLSCDHERPAGTCAHADYFTAWDPVVQAELVERCLNLPKDCGQQRDPAPAPTPSPTATATATATSTPTVTPTPQPAGCDQTVSSLTAAQSAVGSAPSGSTVCLADGTYGALSLSAARSTPVTLRAEHPGLAKLGTVTITGRNVTVANFDVDGASFGINVKAGASDVTIEHNYVHNTPYQVEVASDGPTSPRIPRVRIIGNRLVGTTENAMRFAGFSDVLVEGNEITGCVETGDHVDGIQTFWPGDKLMIRRNYFHDNACQNIFVGKDGQLTDVTIEDNLLVRNMPSPQGCLNTVPLNSIQGLSVTRNTVWGSCSGLQLGIETGPMRDAVVTGNVLQTFEPFDGNDASVFHDPAVLVENNNLFRQAFWTWGASDMGSGSVIDPAPLFPNVAEDNYVLAGSRGVSWKPADQTYGPVL